MPFLLRFPTAQDFDEWKDQVRDLQEKVIDNMLGSSSDAGPDPADDADGSTRGPVMSALKQIGWLTNDFLHIAPRGNDDIRIEEFLGPSVLEFVREGFQLVMRGREQ